MLGMDRVRHAAILPSAMTARSGPKQCSQNIQKNRCRTTVAEPIGETLAELPFTGDQAVCLGHDQAAWCGPERQQGIALGLIEPCSQPRVSVAEIFDIFGREFMGVIRHLHSLPGLLCCIGDSEIEADFTPYSLRAERERR
jgi:hypothetical protein